MLTSKQRAKLRGLASTEDTILQVGKGGVADTLVRQVDDALTARELIKLRVLETCPESVREAAERLAAAANAEVVQVIGTKFVLYRQSHRKDKKDKIVLVEGKKRESVPQREQNSLQGQNIGTQHRCGKGKGENGQHAHRPSLLLSFCPPL